VAQSDYLSNSEYAQTAINVQSLGQTSKELVSEMEAIEVNTGKGSENDLVKEYSKIVGQEEAVVQE
jgi:hypothetical protein